MVGTEGRLHYRKTTLVERFRFVGAAQRLRDGREVLQRLRDIGVLGGQWLLYAGIWWGMSVIHELGQTLGPNYTPQEALAGIKAAAESSGTALGDIDLFELNEAFAAVGLASMQDLGIGDDVVNVNGGAIALGHPVGMSGTRVALTLLLELGRRGGGLGAAALCGGGGQGDAILLKV